MYQAITTFLGINTNTDARSIEPINIKSTKAEATDLYNFDITREGLLVTSKGYSLVSSGSGTDGVRNLLNYDKNSTDRYLLITSGDHHYSITPTNAAWNDLGDYGNQSDYIGGTVYKTEDGGNVLRKAVLGVNGNIPQKTDSGAIAPLGGTPPEGYIMTVFMGRLFVAKGESLYYTDVEDIDTLDTSGSNVIGFNDEIVGLVVNGERMIVLTRSYSQGVKFSYDDSFNLSVPLKEPYERPYGCLSHRSVQPVGSDAYYWSDRGLLRTGTEERYDEKGIPRVMSFSKKIEPSLKFTNKEYRYIASSAYWQSEQQYWLAVPYGTDQFPSKVFVYNENWDAWTVRSGFYPGGLSLFRGEDYEQEMYFGDFNSPNLYKFDDSYSYNGDDYTRKWVSKKFTMGANFRFKRFNRIDITGSMDAGTEFDVTIQVDNTKKKYTIDNTFLLRDSFSDYIGDNWEGSAWIGGDSPSESRFKRFYAPIDFDREIKEGLELQITIENSAAEQPFKIDFIGIDYDVLSSKQVPKRNYVNRQKTT